MKNIWEVLGIEQTKDKRTIRKAYSELVKQYHPEEQPEKYKEIREAYEQALFYVSYSSQDIEVNQNIIFIHEENSSLESILDRQENNIQEDSFVDRKMKELIRNGISSVIQITNQIYETKPNDLEAWKQCFENCKDHEELVLETIFSTTMELITDERIIVYFRDVVEALPREDIDIYNKRLRDLQEKLKKIKKSIFGHSFLGIIDVFSILFMIIAILVCVIGIIWIGYKAIFQTNQPTVSYFFFVFLSTWTLYRLYHISSRNMDKNKHFFYREYKLVGITMLASILSLTYIYTFLSILNVVPNIYGLYYILIIELLGMQYLFKKESYKEVYQYQTLGVEFLMLPNGILLLLSGIAFIAYLMIIIFTSNTYYVVPLIIMLFAFSIGIIFVTLSIDEYYKNIYPTLQNFISWLILYFYLGTAHLAIQFFRTPNIDDLNEESSMVLGFVFLFWFVIISLYLVLKLKRKKKLKKIFTTDSYNAVIGMFEYLSSKCKYGENMENLNEFQKYFYVVQLMEMEINNGGFSQFYFNSTGDYIEKIIEGLKMMGAGGCLELMIQSQSIFSANFDFSNREERQIELEKLTEIEENVEFFERLDNLYSKLDKQVYQYCYDFMIRNKRLFKLK